MSELTLLIHIVCCVLPDLESKGHSTEQVICDQFDEAIWVTHEKLVTSVGQNMKLWLTREKELVASDYISGASWVHPVVLAIDERDREG